MRYILTNDYRGKALDYRMVNLKKGQSCECKGGIIYSGNTPICFNTSQVAYENFADDEDGNGKLRGRWIERIAYWRPKKAEGYRLSERQCQILSDYYPRLIRHDCDSIIFSDKFYHLEIEQYELLAQDLGMKLEDMK